MVKNSMFYIMWLLPEFFLKIKKKKETKLFVCFCVLQGGLDSADWYKSLIYLSLKGIVINRNTKMKK